MGRASTFLTQMFKCGVLLPLDDVTVTLITSTVSAPPLEELQAEQGKLISTTAYITFIQVFKNSVKNYCRTIPTIKNFTQWNFFVLCCCCFF